MEVFPHFFDWAIRNLGPADVVLLAWLGWSHYEIARERKAWNEGRERTVQQAAENTKVWNDMTNTLAALQANMATVIMLQSQHRR